MNNRRVVSGVAALIGVTILLSTWFRGCSPDAQKAHAFFETMPVDRITEVVVEPYAVSSLVTRSFVITDRTDIARLAALVRNAESTALNHPDALWVAVLRFRTPDGDFGGQVERTRNIGVVAIWASDVTSGWNLGTVRSDELGSTLEALATTAGVRRQ